MTETQSASEAATQSAAAQPEFEKTWRYKIGLAMIIGGHVILLAALVLPAIGLLSATMTAVGIVVGEVIALASIVFLGKEGFLAIKTKIFGAFKAEFQRPVGRIRHSVGIILLLLNVFTAVTLAVFAWFSYELDPGAMVWGMSAEEQPVFYATVFLVGELSFPVAIVVLGADWWQRFRDLFVWHQPAKTAASASRETG